MVKKRKKKGKKMTNPDKPKTTKTNNQFFGDEVISVLKMKFRDGQTVASYLRGGGTKGQLRAGIKSGAIEIEPPEGEGA